MARVAWEKSISKDHGTLAHGEGVARHAVSAGSVHPETTAARARATAARSVLAVLAAPLAASAAASIRPSRNTTSA